ncbi:MAG TPA: site-specific DNA-methyltransferase [Anaerohalosphaeraceae bacterium]|jgi:site-specific DNA-methyltransferase (adenine-specific)|nr:site-specific DNA-methyltransferase [Anaerohalosphaeraceae bacterium]HOT73550.1 site-specific DNA-methyltransferase [Anaerohalosphaeraceae bacterium]HQG05486.1 site-specific DNA-methyltransferase [Anaerohalosphaeraceae bacterium]HQI06859.1 site-specific DNA-methyltransferase [Anaerohalosphaeraceae bacterium]HQJ68555.1 site-specific DNA-methyltransferase [Anaerohalosphaeraceae bacterium]
MIEDFSLFNDDCINVLNAMAPQSIDLIFADPPYNLSGNNNLTVRSGKPVLCNKGSWDEVENLHSFNLEWIKACERVLKPQGTIWISGTLHNHPSIGVALKEIGMWIINDIIWYKPNATPLLSRNRLAPSTELIWVASKTKKYYFNYDVARALNNGKQMRNLWILPAKKHVTSHPTEKPLDLLERIIQIGSKEDDVILDPFLGSGTTGVAARKLKRKFIGIEIDENYCRIAHERIIGAYSEIGTGSLYDEPLPLV